MGYTIHMEVHHGQGFRSLATALEERTIILRGADPLSQSGFTQVPNAILRSDKLSPGAKLTYAMLLSYAWVNDFCFPGQETLAKDMGSGLRSIVRYIRELEEQDCLTIHKRGQGKVNVYELNLTVKWGNKKGGKS